tara:strand:- start:93 stop:254 length:162 start_codon:yes stop_codon:yes gene_type:complete
MNKNLNSKNGFIHLYNPKKEGLGSYDANYINAYKKVHRIKIQKTNKTNRRYAA